MFPFTKIFVARVLSKDSLLLGYIELKVDVRMGIETRWKLTHLCLDSNTYTVPSHGVWRHPALSHLPYRRLKGNGLALAQASGMLVTPNA